MWLKKSEAIAPCKEMSVILVNKLVDKKIIIGKKEAEEEERHMGSLTPKKLFLQFFIGLKRHCILAINACG
jgi:hypothetical protein